ncbi:MAG: phytanoyl-CoA dioxygenase family protein [Campylobacteraceae bacterium]|nr:phytanoyl-CoA dioxygenase family protein [Campylobacteraceae bacterium]
MSAKKEYDDKGYVILRNFLNADELLSITKCVNRIYESWMNKNRAEIFENQLVNMHSLSKKEYFKNNSQDRLAFFNAISIEKIVNLLESMFGSEIYFHNTQVFFNPLNEKRLPYWHRDMQYSSIADDIQKEQQNKMLSLHIRIPLEKEKGLELIPGSHKRWDNELEKNVRLELNGHHNNEELPNAKLIEVNTGDMVIFSSQMIHRGNYNLNTSRKAFDLCLGNYHKLSFDFFDEKVLPNKEEIKLIKNKQWFVCANENFIKGIA